ncbi:MerR family transcriptional regulator, heat shock protein HspR [Kytococcus aerolatus]|uniref:MerR family transcriptional regulator, heat shock protein HspR n=1 Tax=Kytococcus aerolatus TaxID=592308 RepID=A0A212U5B4_9MICO|nr:helix-turn-helix transcriptional regulator [Kytococcus aerolatus]SNC73340.1 MerR family transcriptional regulator, heat shock protein HspR [Kytococcus aerolatus]
MSDTRPVYVISVAAELTGMHAQTLRQYDRLGLVTPSRARGGGRRYSEADVEQLREVQRLSHEEGISLAGIRRIMELQRATSRLEDRLEELTEEVERLRQQAAVRDRVFAAGREGAAEMVAHGRRPSRRVTAGELVLWRPARHPARRD